MFKNPTLSKGDSKKKKSKKEDEGAD